MNSKRVLAIIGIILLVSLYIVTLFFAIFDKSASGSFFYASLYCTFVIPILIWVYTRAYDWFKSKDSDDQNEHKED